MTTTRKTFARVGASLAITALALVGITGTQLAATAAPGEISPWTEPAPENVIITEFIGGDPPQPPNHGGATGTDCVLPDSPYVITRADNFPNTAPSFAATAVFTTLSSYLAADSTISVPMLNNPCDEAWGFTGNYFLTDLRVQLFGESGVEQEEIIIEADEALHLTGETLTATGDWHRLSSGEYGSSVAGLLYIELEDGRFLYGGLQSNIDLTGIVAPVISLEVPEYTEVVVDGADIIAGCTSDPVCTADGLTFIDIPEGAVIVNNDGVQTMRWVSLRGEWTFTYIVTDSVEGTSSDVTTGTISVSPAPDFLGLAEAPSKSFTVVAGETITITHDLLGDVYATAFETSEPEFIEPFFDVDGIAVPGWVVDYLTIPEGGTLIEQPILEGLTGEPANDLRFVSTTPGVYEFTYTITIISKGYGFTTQLITSTITVTAEEPELPKVTG